MGKTVFVTVGSTKFDELIENMCSIAIVDLLKQQGFSRLVLQIGKGNVQFSALEIKSKYNLDVDIFQYKDSLHPDMQAADLIVSHAGAGSIVEALKLGKRLIVVVNEKLMHNHQSELADELSKEQQLISTTISNLHEALTRLPEFAFCPFPPAADRAFGNYIDKMLNVAF